MAACMTALAPYDIPNSKVDGYDVVVNKPKVAAYRAPGAPAAAFAVEQAIDELAEMLDIDPLKFRLANTAREGTRGPGGRPFPRIGTRSASRQRCPRRTTTRRSKGLARAGRRLRLLVQRRRRVERDRERQRGRHGGGGDREPRHRRLARLDGDHGGRDAGDRL
jgi:CO/xanthine dehydrogenase Mo-binding subunit